MGIPVIRGVADIADAYDGFVLDLWGVLYDGGTAYPWALDTLHKLRERGKRLVVLSNGPRRADAVADRLAAAGIARSDYDGVMSSGEEAWQSLAGKRPDPWYEELGKRCLYIGTDGDRAMLDGLDLVEVSAVEAADFILAIGPRDPSETVEDYEALLLVGASEGVRMVCANPDLLVHRLGREEICAGALALRYEALGGDVRWHGKPHASVYDSSMALFGTIDQTRVLAVGDSFRTDIKGANGVRLDSLLVAGGIHAAELCDADGKPDAARIAGAAGRAGVTPTIACGRFEW